MVEGQQGSQVFSPCQQKDVGIGPVLVLRQALVGLARDCGQGH